MTTEDTTIDFAEDGRLLAAATPGPWRHGPESHDITWSPATHCASGMRVECRRGFGSHADDISAMVALRNHAAAYREAVLALDCIVWVARHQFSDAQGFDMGEMDESLKDGAAALARFRNITEGQS